MILWDVIMKHIKVPELTGTDRFKSEKDYYNGTNSQFSFAMPVHIVGIIRNTSIRI